MSLQHSATYMGTVNLNGAWLQMTHLCKRRRQARPAPATRILPEVRLLAKHRSSVIPSGDAVFCACACMGESGQHWLRGHQVSRSGGRTGPAWSASSRTRSSSGSFCRCWNQAAILLNSANNCVKALARPAPTGDNVNVVNECH